MAEVTSPVQPGWTPMPKPMPPAPVRKRSTGLVVAVIGLAVLAIALAAMSFWQASKAADARNEASSTSKVLDATKADLSSMKVDLTTAQADLSDVRAEVVAKDTQLAACDVLVEISTNQQDAIMLLFDLSSAHIRQDFAEGSAVLDDIKVIQEDTSGILDDAGFADYQEVYAACSPGGVNS